MNEYVLMNEYKSRKIFNSGGKLSAEWREGLSRVTADCCSVSPWKLGWGGGEREVQDGGRMCVPVPDSCCVAETTQHGGASILRLKIKF